MAGQLGQYQAILLHNPNVALQTTMTLNPATLLLASDSNPSLTRDCLQILDSVYSS